MIRKMNDTELKNLYEALGETLRAKGNRRLPYLREIVPTLCVQKRR
jgi:hypothetical protein